jgi:competence CoiA-like predicted nuclease
MRTEFAISDNNERIPASPRTLGYCPVCKTRMIPRCGSKRKWHWSHKPKVTCDHWWENETPWHRQWKEKVPEEFREIVIEKDGVKHIADIQFSSGVVVELQNSRLSFAEKGEREKFYQKMYWILNAENWNVKKLLDCNFFGDVLYSMKPRQDWFQDFLNFIPIFLDLGGNEIIQISEFSEIKKKEVLFWGRQFQYDYFVNNYFNERFSDIDSIKISRRCAERQAKNNQDTQDRIIGKLLKKNTKQISLPPSWAEQEELRQMEAEEKERIFRETHSRQTRTVDSISQEIEQNARDAIARRDKEYSSICNRKQWYIPYRNPNVDK